MQPSRFRTVSLQFSRSYRTAKQIRGKESLPALQRKPIRILRKPFPTSRPSKASSAQENAPKAAQNEDVFVKFFEQDIGAHSKRRQVGPDLDEDEAAQLEAEVKNLKKEIADFKIESQMPESLANLYMTEEERESARIAFDKELERLEPPLSGINAQEMRFDVYIEPYQVRANVIIPHQSQLLLNRLNEALDGANLHPTNEKHRRDISKWYSHCKLKVRSFLNMIPDEGWTLLWKVQSQDTVSNPNRSFHLKTLAEDMLSIGIELNQEQTLGRIEGIFLEGKRDEAIELWENERRAAKSIEPGLMELGIHMFTRKGDLERAARIFQDLSKSNATYDPRVILTLIHAFNAIKTTESHLRAWNFYTELRERLSTDITMQDFDELCIGFLQNGRTDLALAIFRDMMSHDPSTKRNERSKFAINGFEQLVSSLDSAEKVNEASLDALSYLPIRFQNKYFFASWLKKLIGMGEIDSAAKVIELMYERKIPPDAKHVNGLIGAWFREGNQPARKKAESIAWEMIQERLDFVTRRDKTRIERRPHVESMLLTSQSDTSADPSLAKKRPVPAATIETFSILVQHYTRRAELTQVRRLRDLLSHAQIPMNSYFMNHLLFGVMRTSTPQDVWNRYQVLSSTVNPDIETFDCLWECMKFQVDTSRNQRAAERGFPNPRELFAIMMKWFRGQNQSDQKNAVEDIDMDTYRDLIRCFCITRDLEGTFIALQAMRDVFKVAPDPRTGRMLLLQISRLNSPVPLSPSEKKKMITSAEAKTNVANATSALNEISNGRRAILDQKGTPFDSLNQSQQLEETHRTLLELVYAVLRTRLGAHGEVVSALSQATNDMGVEMFNLDEVMAVVESER